jgi:hypothetical protein
MNNLKPEILSAIIAYIGVILGLIWSELRNYFNSRKERKRKLNELLYYLLHLHKIIYTTNVNEITNLFLNQLKKRFPNDNISEEDFIKLKQTLAEDLEFKFHKLNTYHDLNNIVENYNKCVDLLSADYPFLAYEIWGNASFMKFIVDYRDYIKQCNELITIPVR